VEGFINDNLGIADIVKGSNEDFEILFNTDNFDDTIDILRNKIPNNFIYTANANGIYTYLNKTKNHLKVDRIEPISAVGAGDTFNAGLIYSIIEQNIYKEDLSSGKFNWTLALQTADKFAKHVCMSYSNYLSNEFAQKISS